jgi:hypothetical protein
MNKLFRGLIAGYGAKKLGTGCFSTILIFILIWVALGQCEGTSFGEKQKLKKNPGSIIKNKADLAQIHAFVSVQFKLHGSFRPINCRMGV